MRLASLVALFTCKGAVPKSPWALGVVLAGLLVVGISSAALGQDTILDSGTTTVSTDTNFDGDLYVATTGTATLEVIAGGYATNTTGYLGFNAGGVGTATVLSGTWANSGNLYVGGEGTGTLNVTGGSVTNSDGYIATSNNSVGTVTVSSGTWANGGMLVVGLGGTGTLNVTGGSVTNSRGYLGNSNNSVGTVTVSGGTWATSGELKIGNYYDDPEFPDDFAIATGTLTMTGGLVTVSGTLSRATYNGTSLGTINLNAGGTLQIGTGGAGSRLDVGNLTNDGTLVFNQSNNYTYSDSISGSGAVTKAGAGTLTLSAANTYTGLTTIVGGTLAYGTNNTLGTGGVAVNGGVLNLSTFSDSVGTVTLTSGTIAGTGTLTSSSGFTMEGTGLASASLAGAVGLTKSGNGTLTLSANNGYTGRTQVNGGVLAVNNTNALAGTGTISFGGGSLQYSASNTRDYSAKILNSGSAIAIDTNGQNVTFATGLGSSNTGGLTKSGAGTLTLTASNGYTGGTTISSGTLQVGNGGTTGSIDGNVVNNAMLTFNRSDALTYSGEISGSGGLRKLGSTTLTLSGSNGYTGVTNIATGFLVLNNTNALAGTGTISFTGGGTLRYSASNTVDYSAKILSNGIQIKIDTNGQNVTFASGLAASNTGGLRKSGGGTLTLSASNGYTGDTVVSGGTLALNNTNALAGSGTIAFGGGTLQYSASNTVDYSAKILNAFNSAISIDTNSQNVTFASGLGSSNTGGLTKTGLGTLTLTASNGYTGTTLVNGGVLALGNANALARTGTLSFGGGSLQYSASNTVDYSSKILSSGSAISIDTNGQNVTFATGLAASNTGGLTKLGNGTLTLSGSSSYTGATAVNGGKLLVNGQLGNTAVAVNASGLLSGSGTILGGVTVASSGTLSPGNSPGVLTVGSLSLLAGSHTLMEITGTSASLYDQIVGNGSGGLAYGGTLDLIMSGSYADQTTFHLFSNFSSPPTGDFAAVVLDATGGAYDGLTFTGTAGVWTSTWTTNHQRLVFSTATGDLVVVPEPSTYAMVIAGLACGGWQMMRRRRLRQAATLTA
jgi:autotransporter-associated beta strand protein/T5SS/PEP-CTERM-associated repeat protein